MNVTFQDEISVEKNEDEKKIKKKSKKCYGKLVSLKNLKFKYKKKLAKVLRTMFELKILKDFCFLISKHGGSKILFENHKTMQVKKLISILFSNSRHEIPYFLKKKLHKLKIFDPKCFKQCLSKFTKASIKKKYPLLFPFFFYSFFIYFRCFL